MNRKTSWLVNTALVLVSTAASLYAAEAYLAFEEYNNELGTDDRIRRAAERVDAPFDPRSRPEVVRDLKAQGKDAQPAMAPSTIVESDGISSVDGGRLFPFGGIANATTVFCNESGAWSIYESDSYGFRNPNDAWVKEGVDVAFIGDSFTHGACLQDGEDIPGIFRNKGLRTLNLGIGGTGPLIQLGVLTEYAAAMRPRYVAWIFFAEDPRDVVHENSSPTIMRYLEDGFSQDLMKRNDEVQRSLRSYIDVEYERHLAQIKTARADRLTKITDRLISDAKVLTKLRRRVANLGAREKVTEGREELKLSLMAQALRAAKSRVGAWGGKMVFVYLPTWYSYGSKFDSYGVEIDANYLLRQDIFKQVQAEGIPILDLQANYFDHLKEPTAHYNFGTYGLFTKETYGLVAAEIESYFRKETDLFR